MFEQFAHWLVYQLGGLSPASQLGTALHFWVMDTTKIFVMLVMVSYDGKVVHAGGIPEQKQIESWL